MTAARKWVSWDTPTGDPPAVFNEDPPSAFESWVYRVAPKPNDQKILCLAVGFLGAAACWNLLVIGILVGTAVFDESLRFGEKPEVALEHTPRRPQGS